jgi:PAS domain-containing protein
VEFSGAMMRTAAFALIDGDRQIVRSTDGFSELGAGVAAACAGDLELGRVLQGEANFATLSIGDAIFTVEAVMDSQGVRHVLVGLPGEPATDGFESAPLPEDLVARLRGPLEQSPLIGWLKDPSGRHLFVNSHYAEAFGIAPGQVIGGTDAELPPGETVDGPRLSLAEDGFDEPDDFGYTVPAFGNRPALSAVRFAIRDPQGEPIVICGVASTVDQARMVEEEAERLAQVDTLSQTNGSDVRAEVLEEWGLALGGGEVLVSVPAEVDSPEPEVDAAPEFELAPEFEPAPALEPAPEFEFEPAPVPAFAPEPEAVEPEWAPVALETEPEPPAEEPLDLTERWDDCIRGLQEEAAAWRAEVAQARSMAERAQVEARQALDERDAAYAEGQGARTERDELARALALERERNQELSGVIAQLRGQIGDLGRTIDQTLGAEPASLGDSPVAFTPAA